MTWVQATIELFLFTLFLSVIALICITCRVAPDSAFVALFLAGTSYALTTFNRGDPNTFTDKHL